MDPKKIYTEKDLPGLKFQHRSSDEITYSIKKVVFQKAFVQWTGPRGFRVVSYPISHVLEYINTGIWKQII